MLRYKFSNLFHPRLLHYRLQQVVGAEEGGPLGFFLGSRPIPFACVSPCNWRQGCINGFKTSRSRSWRVVLYSILYSSVPFYKYSQYELCSKGKEITYFIIDKALKWLFHHGCCFMLQILANKFLY